MSEARIYLLTFDRDKEAAVKIAQSTASSMYQDGRELPQG